MTTTQVDDNPMDSLQADLDAAKGQLAVLGQDNLALQAQVADLQHQLTAARTDAAYANDAFKLELERHNTTRQYLASVQHSCEQWQQTAQANERLHNVALQEARDLRDQLQIARSQ